MARPRARQRARPSARWSEPSAHARRTGKTLAGIENLYSRCIGICKHNYLGKLRERLIWDLSGSVCLLVLFLIGRLALAFKIWFGFEVVLRLDHGSLRDTALKNYRNIFYVKDCRICARRGDGVKDSSRSIGTDCRWSAP